MPDKKEQAKLRMQKMRNKKSVTSGSVTKEDVTQEMVPAAYVMGLHGKLKTLPERPRYLTLSDGQVLDRLHQPEAKGEIVGMIRCNESSYNFKPRKGR